MFKIKTKILSKINKKIGENVLKQIRIRPIGYLCNHSCPMCWRENLPPKVRTQLIKATKTDLTTSEYINLIENLPKSVERVVLTGGGEPLILEGVNEIIKKIKNTGRTGHIITNGTLIKGELLEVFINSHWDNIGISFNAASRKTYKIVNGANTFDLVLENIREIIRKRGANEFPKIQLTYVIQKTNYSEIEDFANFCVNEKIDSINFSPISPHDLTVINQISDLALNDKERKETIKLLKRAEKIAKRSGTLYTNIETLIETYEQHPSFNSKKTKESYWGVRYCDMVENNIDIGADGDVKPCCYGWQIDSHLDFNVRTQNIMDIWNSKQYQVFRKNLREGNFPSLCSKYCTFLLPQK